MSIDLDLLDGGVAVITLNRPEKRNALDAEHYQALSEAWTRVRDDDAIRVAIVTGAGDKVFSAGADLKSWIGRKVPQSELWQTQKGMLLNRGLEVYKPVIAAINGHCLAGGMTLMLATDLRVTADHATFALSEVKRGIIPANGGTQRLPAQLPHAIAMELLLIGDAIDAQTAARWGLVNRVVPADQVMATALELARRVAANAPLAVQAIKELALRGPQEGLAAGLRFEQLVQNILQRTEDAAEGRRPPGQVGWAYRRQQQTGDDGAAKKQVAQLISSLGFVAIDAGPLKHARYLEAVAGFGIYLAYGAGKGTSIAPFWIERAESVAGT